MVDSPNKQVAVEIAMSGSVPLPSAEGANFFHLTRAGMEVQFLVGTVNLMRVHEARLQNETTARLTPEISHRFLVSLQSMQHLKMQIDRILASAEAKKVGQ